jgi:hypothetical protein
MTPTVIVYWITADGYYTGPIYLNNEDFEYINEDFTVTFSLDTPPNESLMILY